MNKDDTKNHRNGKLLIGDVVRSWLFKRIMLNIAWFIINLIGLIVGAVMISKYLPDWVLLWYALVWLYGVSYRIISIIIFDALIGNG